MELKIAFTEKPANTGAFVFDLSLDGENHCRDTAFTNPLVEKDLKDLRWYLEDFLDWPFNPIIRSRGEEIEAKLDEWGAALFRALFAGPEARVLYDRLVETKDGERFLTLQSPDARVLRLPWELLRDKAGPLITAGVSIRRHVEQPVTPTVPQFTLPLNVLYVIARPIDAGFIDPRSSVGGVMEALAPLIETGFVTVDFVRPPTFEQLSRTLERGRYDMLHFDGHGFYDDRLGLGGLAFEQADHRTHLVTAGELGDLLNRRGIALAVLDACRTGREVEAKAFSSVAAQLITSGVGSVICMSYSVYVEAARIFTRRFYESLVAGQTVGAATRAGRESLKTNPVRLAEAGANRTLKDWFLPLLYQRGKDAAAVGRSAGPAPAARAEMPALAGFPEPPRYGFTGRSFELLQVERTLLDHRVAVLHGFGGAGKTALAREAGLWLTRTGMFPGGAVFLSFETGGDEDQAVLSLGNFLEGADFSRKSPPERLAFVEAHLKEHPTLVVWDNFESVFDEGVTLPAARAGLLRLAGRWAELRGPVGTNQRSCLLITTRQEETAIPGAAKVELGGFSPRDALDFAAVILGKEGIPRDRLDKEALQQLMDLLGNHALSLSLVLPKLKTMDPGQMLQEFETLLPGFKTGEGKKRDESLQVSLDFSLRRLGEETRRLLPSLAVFQGGGLEPNILAVTQIPPETWNAVRPELQRAALIRAEELSGVTVPFIHFHPTLGPHLSRLLSRFSGLRKAEPAATRAELETRYRQAYYEFAKYLCHADDKTPTQARSLALREMPNLKRGLTLMLAAGEVNIAVDFADSIVRFLNNFGRWRERDALLEKVHSFQATVTSYQSAVGSGQLLTKAEFLMVSQRGEMLRSQGRAAEAEKIFCSLLARMEAGADYDAGYDRCLTLGRLGRSLQAQGKPETAAETYRETLVAAGKLEQKDDVRRMAGAIHTDLADVLRDLARYDDAREQYEITLEIMQNIDDKRNVAAVLSQLGTLALRQGHLTEARQRYTAALTAFRNLGEPESEASVLNQLGGVAYNAQDWDEMERCLKESLVIRERFGDKVGAAKNCNNLALAAENAGRPQEAERWYHRGIEIDIEIGNPKELAIDYSNLAELLLAQNRLDEAEQYAHRAREIKETLDLSSEPWKDYEILARIADKRAAADPAHAAEHAKAAQAWRQKAEAAIAAFEHQSGGQWSRHGAQIAQAVQQWEPIIEAIVAACKGHQQAAQKLEPVLQKLGETNDWRNLVAVLRRLLANERGPQLTEGLDRTDTAIVQKILAQL